MCGITGIISFQPIEKGIIEKMTDKISHRGPDGFGYYYGDTFVFGHRRLAIIDTSVAGHQPMEYMERYVITYNGEIYNHIEIRQELKTKGYKFKSQTDTEVIMAAYDYWGWKCLNHFNGMWAFVIYDTQKKVYFISRDRFGKKPLYYCKSGDTFIFASEIKAILSYPKVEKKANLKFLNEYVRSGCKAYTKETAFESIYRFDYSSFFEGSLDDLLNNFVIKKFWELNPNLQGEKFDEKKAKEYAKKYYELLEDAVRIRLRADVKVGSALSGGLDSSSIVYLVNKLLKEQGKSELQETFSSVYKTPGTRHCDESHFINILAQKLCVHSNQIEPKENNIPNEHEKMIYMMEDPPESTCMSGWHTFQLVSSTPVKVTLDGQGADEQLGGYLPYISTHLSSLPLKTMIQEAKHFMNIPYAKKYIFRGIILNILKRLFGEKVLLFIFKNVFKKRIEFNLNKQLAEDTMTNLITLIHYSDHVSMGHSIESRMPFMDYRVVEFLASLPACYKLRNGWTKYLARLAFDGKLPDEITWRKDKMGWPIPEEYWFRGNLKEWFISEIKKSAINKMFSINIEAELNRKVNITKLVRYLNISKFEQLFFNKNERNFN